MILSQEMFDANIVMQIASDSTTNQKIYVQFTPRTGKHWIVYEKDKKPELCVGLQQAIARWNQEA